MIELMLTIVVASLLMGMAISKIDLGRFAANASVQILGTTMIASQREAVTKQSDVILTFDSTRSTVHLAWDLNDNGSEDAGEHTRSIVLDERMRFGLGGAPARSFGPNAINFNKTVGGLPALIFHRTGSASGIGGFYLTSARAKAAAAAGNNRFATDTRAVEIVRATGRTEWYRWNGTTWVRGF
jgi:hypothetical protein